MISPEKLDEIEKRAKEATSGPWDEVQTFKGQARLRSLIAGPSTGPGEDSRLVLGEIVSGIERGQSMRDARFIAHARQDVPELVAEVRRLREALDSVWAAVGDRLLAKGPLAKEYAHGVMAQVRQALGEA